MDLPGPQDALVRAVAAANPRTVVVLNCGAPVTMPWIDCAPALLLAYYPGQEGGTALASILTGDTDPSGRLPISLPARIEDSPAFLNYPGEREVLYGERVYVGYRYYDTKGVDPLFPFGAGLSYTEFEYDGLTVPRSVSAGEPIPVRLQVTNRGARTGKEVVQVYVRDVASTVDRPEKELKAFQKVCLEAGDGTEVAFELGERDLAFYDTVKGLWVVEPGEFEILVGHSSRDIRAGATVTVV
ncbi:glycoside hydrolase family 3 C-terminal domain-containing protein, partial [Verrucomicrobiota bacterium]